MMSDWVGLGTTVGTSLISGFVGGCAVAFRLGAWRQRVDDRLNGAERRLARGDAHVDAVPLLRERTEMILSEIKGLRAELRDQRALTVTHEECNRRHDDAH